MWCVCDVGNAATVFPQFLLPCIQRRFSITFEIYVYFYKGNGDVKFIIFWTCLGLKNIYQLPTHIS